MSKRTNKLLLCALALVMVSSFIGAGVSFNGNQVIAAANDSAYVELYSPTGNAQVVSANREYLNPTVVENSASPTGNALSLDYKPGHATAIDLAIPVEAHDAEGFEGLAMWVDVPETADSYSFTLFVVKENVNNWQPMNLGSQLVLVDQAGNITTQTSMWKRQHLNGFSGWVIMPMETYPDPVPEEGKLYRFVVMFEVDQGYEGDVERTTPITISIGTIGYYTDYDAFLYSAAGAERMDEYYIEVLKGYIEQIEGLKVSSEEQLVKKNKMLVYFSNIKENYKSLPENERVEIAKGLDDDYSRMMQDFRYGQVKDTPFVMSFAITSDTHFTNSWINENFLGSLADAI